MKPHALAALLLAGPALAGTVAPMIEPVDPAPSGFDKARRPITNITMFDSALPTSTIRPIFIYHNLPGSVNTTIGPVPMGGDVQIYALQLEWALSETFSLVATKDGYVDINPGNPAIWGDESGFANLAAGVKWAFLYQPENQFAMSTTVTFELPTGNHDVFQGEGELSTNLILNALKMWGDFQLAGSTGVHIPFDGQLTTHGFLSAHASYEVVPWFIPLVEVNWHHVIDAGNGRPNYFAQAGGLVPAIATFEGFDLLNFGAANASQNRDFVSAAVGFRSRITDCIDLGFAYEVPLTDESDGILDDRFTVDLVWRF